ncbi:putative glucose-6-phosphate 1-epimerase [Phragmites australis]|uniref:putative glucose-6-phosphate 1-epimerase n=1 Tax=Phragmites australis TaxID=29695 RepID=UPI002D79CFD9|nr:putative glucose-6-phosphate 1-epimerase [Phragmites australis]
MSASASSPLPAAEEKAQLAPVEHCKGVNGLDKVVLREVRGSSAEVYLYGGHVTSWKDEHGEELLFVSNKAIFKPPKPIRGGIPICFPQFSNFGNLEQHGFARNRSWSIDADPPPFPVPTSNRAYVDLILKSTEEDLKIWPHSFEYRLRVALGPGGDLMLTSRIRNTNADGKSFSFTFAYHTYFSISDISEVRVEGLETLDYLDNLQDRARFTEQGDAIVFESELDRIYLGTPSKIAIIDHEKKRTFVVRKAGLPDAVVWNPWDKKAKAMSDFGDDEYKRMVCVEAAAIEKHITLKPSEEWTGKLELSAVPSSYYSGQLDPVRVIQESSVPEDSFS